MTLRQRIGFCLGLLPLALGGQVFEAYDRAWAARYDGPAAGFDQVRALAVAPNGDIVAVGQSRGFGDVFQALVWRITPAGAPSSVWPDTGAGVGVRRFSSPIGHAGAEAVAIGPDDSVHVGGFVEIPFQDDDYQVLKLDAVGNLSSTWPDVGHGTGVRRYNRLSGPDQVRAIALADNGDVFVTGRSAGVTVPPAAVTIRYTAAGAAGFVAGYYSSGTLSTEPVGLLPWADGGVVVGGRTMWPNGRNAYFLLRYTSAGALSSAWPGATNGVRLYTGLDTGTNSEMAGLAQRADGGVVATGRSANTDGRYDATTISWAANGDLLWVVRRRAFAPQNDAGVAVAVGSDGDIFVLSESVSPTTGADFEVLRYTAAGAPSPAWPDVGWGVGVRRWNGAANGADRPRAMALDRLDNVYVTGESAIGGGAFALVMVKFTADGQLAWADSYEGPGGDIDQPTAVVIGANDVVVAGGSSTGVGSGQDAVVLAYTQQLPGWVDKPDSLLGAAGTNLRLSAAASSPGDLTYTWKRGGNVIGTGPALFPGPLGEDTAGEYELTVSDGFNVLRTSFLVGGMSVQAEFGNLMLRVFGPVGRTLAIDQSNDMQAWVPWQSFTLGASAMEFTPPLPNPMVFYRLRLP